MSMTWEEKKELIHSRRKEMFPKLRDRWVFSDIHCNRGSSSYLYTPTGLQCSGRILYVMPGYC